MLLSNTHSLAYALRVKSSRCCALHCSDKLIRCCGKSDDRRIRLERVNGNADHGKPACDVFKRLKREGSLDDPFILDKGDQTDRGAERQCSNFFGSEFSVIRDILVLAESIPLGQIGIDFSAKPELPVGHRTYNAVQKLKIDLPMDSTLIERDGRHTGARKNAA